MGLHLETPLDHAMGRPWGWPMVPTMDLPWVHAMGQRRETLLESLWVLGMGKPLGRSKADT